MKKIIVVSAFFISIVSVQSQSYFGLFHDNYAGVQSVLNNPASIADSRFKADINLVSFNATFGNDLYAVNFSEALKDGYDFDTQAKKSFTDNNNVNFNFDAMGLSFMFNLAPKHTVAFFSRVRTMTNLTGVRGKLINELSKEVNKNDFNDIFFNPNFTTTAWGEFGLSYAFVLLQKEQHFLKGGLSAKYLQGIGNAHFKGENINVKYVENTINDGLSTYTTTGKPTYGSSQDFDKDDTIDLSGSKGFGLDFGLVYEYRPDFEEFDGQKDKNKYKIRFGLSVTDLGSINYENGIRNSYNFNKTVTQSEIDDAESFDSFLNQNYPKTVLNEPIKSKLPTALHADVDWKIYGKFYLNFNTDFSLTDVEALNQNSIENRFSLTPRIETKWVSLYVPVSLMEYSGTKIGIGLRTGVFFVGSGSAITNAFTKESKSLDFHFGAKIPIFQ